MSSIRDQMVARCAAALTAAGVTTERSREIAIARNATPIAIVSPKAEESDRISMAVEHHRLRVSVEIFVRADPWDAAADAYAVTAHLALLADGASQAAGTLGALGAIEVRKLSTEWIAEEADRTAGVVEMVYQITYLASRADISAPPIP